MAKVELSFTKQPTQSHPSRKAVYNGSEHIGYIMSWEDLQGNKVYEVADTDGVLYREPPKDDFSSSGPVQTFTDGKSAAKSLYKRYKNK